LQRSNAHFGDIELSNELSPHVTNCQWRREHIVAGGFQRLVNKRSLPDYFDVIKEPIAFSTIRVCWNFFFVFLFSIPFPFFLSSSQSFPTYAVILYWARLDLDASKMEMEAVADLDSRHRLN
jgi:hypothetical protein